MHGSSQIHEYLIIRQYMSTTRWDGHYLGFNQMVILLPLWEEIQWLESVDTGFGGLRLVLDKGNNEKSHVQYSLDFIESGEYREIMHEKGSCWKMFSDDDIERQLNIAKALIQLPETVIQMVCRSLTLTEELFDHLYNTDDE